MRVPGGCALLVISVLLGGLWLLGMSWSHNFGSSSFQLQETLVVGGAVISFVAGVGLLMSAYADRDDREEKTEDSRRPPPPDG